MNGDISPSPEGHKVHRWFLGMEQKSERRIKPQEADAVKRRIFLLKTRPIQIIFVAAILISPVILLNSLQYNSKILDLTSSIVAIFTLLLGLPILILVTKDSYQAAAILTSDLRAGRVFIFEGSITAIWNRHKIFKRLFKEHLIDMDVNGKQRIEVLPVSGAVMDANGLKPDRWREGVIVEATAPPEQHYDAIVTGPEGDIGEQADLLQRHMSQGEIAELALHITRRKRPPSILVFLSVWLLVLIVALSLHASEGKLRQWFDAYHWQTVLVCISYSIVSYRYIRDLRIVRLMNQDVGLKMLKIIRPKPEFEYVDKEKIPVLEVLPISLICWSSDGRPYSWRLSKTRHSHRSPSSRQFQ
jgi:hypothetical protein